MSLAGVVWLVTLAGGSLHASQPNLLVLMAEDLSGRVGAFGDPVARTPNLDRLAEKGVRFPNTFTAAGVCAPSRAAFITGVHQISLGAMHMRTSTSPVATYMAVPDPEVRAFPELLRRVGYYTFTDRKLDYQFSGVFAGTGPETIWDAEGTAVTLETAIRSAAEQKRPFFGLINFLTTHESATFLPDHTQSDAGRAVAARAAAARAALAGRTDPASVTVPPYYPDEPAVRGHIADHYDNVQVMDAQVGGLLRTLEEQGLTGNTIVVWTTDHGDALPRAKRELYDSGIRVPMIVHWPDGLRPAQFSAGTLDERLISFVDLAPALLAMAGLPAETFHQGRDPFAAGTPARRYVYASRDRMDEQRDRVRAVRDERFKYLRFFDPGTPGAVHLAYRDQGRIMQRLWHHLATGTLNEAQRQWFEPRPREALFDLASDPWELVNLAEDPDHLPVLTRLRMAYAEWRLRIPDLADLPEAELAERFWPGGSQPVTADPWFEPMPEGRLAVRATPGAAIEVDTGNGWRPYTGPLPVSPDRPVRARAVRYGQALSAEVAFPSSP